MTERARCSLTRAIALHATHHYPAGGPAERHGHLYRIEVTVGGLLGPADAAVVDLAAAAAGAEW